MDDKKEIDFEALSEFVAQAQSALDAIRAALPASQMESHSEEAEPMGEELDEAAEPEESAEVDEPKAMKKMALMKIMAKE